MALICKGNYLHLSTLSITLIEYMQNCQETLQITQTLFRSSRYFPYRTDTFFRLSGHFLDRQVTFQIFLTLSRSTRHFLNCLDTFQIIQTLFRSSRPFPNHPDILRIICFFCIASGHFPNYPEILLSIMTMSQKLSGFAKLSGQHY